MPPTPTQVDEDLMRSKSRAGQPTDIHNPPLKPIAHQEYPKMLYLWPKDKTLHPGTKTAIANDADEEKALIAKGYRLQPHVQDHGEELPDGFEPDVVASDEQEVAGAQVKPPARRGARNQ